MNEEKKLIITEIRDGYLEPIITEKDYIFGANSPVPDVILEPTGQWDDMLPEDETQIKNYDVFGCVPFSTNNQIEILSKKIFGGQPNYSDRALYNMIGIVPPGTNPANAYETIRKSGLLDEKDLAWTSDIDTLAKYSQPRPLPQTLLDRAKQWVRDIYFKHEYLPTNGQISQETLKLTLQRSPVAVGVYAWAFDTETGKYVRLGADGHWTCCIGYKDNDYFLIYDTYAPFVKKLDWNFGFTVGKKIHLRKKTDEEKKLDNISEQITLMQKVVALLRKVIYFLTS